MKGNLRKKAMVGIGTPPFGSPPSPRLSEASVVEYCSVFVSCHLSGIGDVRADAASHCDTFRLKCFVRIQS